MIKMEDMKRCEKCGGELILLRKKGACWNCHALYQKCDAATAEYLGVEEGEWHLVEGCKANMEYFRNIKMQRIIRKANKVLEGMLYE